MDKYEYTVKADKIKQLVGRKDYATAARIAAGIDWSRVQDVRMLMMVAEAFEKTGQFEEAKEILLAAYDLVPIGKGMLYKLTEICLKQKRIGEAENYYEAYSKAAPNDTGRFTLRYEIACARKESTERKIDILEQFERLDMDERLFYELAMLYHKSGRGRECVEMCDRIILWFGEGEYVDAAIELKNRYSGAVAEVRRKQEEATENRRRRIEEMEASIEELDQAGEWFGEYADDEAPAEEIPGDADGEEEPEKKAPLFEIPEEYFDEPGDTELYEEPAGDMYDTAPVREGRPDIWEDPSIADMTVGELLGENSGEEEYFDGPFDEDAGVVDDFEEDGLDDLPADEEGYVEEYAEDDGFYEDEEPARGIDLTEFVQAGSARGEGPDVEMFSWMNFDDSQGSEVGRRIWESLEKAEKDMAYRPDADVVPEPGYEDFRLEAPGAEDAAEYAGEAAASSEDFSRTLEAALTEEVAAFDDVPAAPETGEAPAETYYEAPEPEAPEEVPAPAAETPSVPMAFAVPEKEIGGAVLPAVHGSLDPSWQARLYSRRFFDEQGFALPEDRLPADLDDTKKLELPWTYEEQTKKLDELKDIRFGGDAFAKINLSPEQELVDPDRFQGDGTDYVDLSAVREETETKRAQDAAEADALAAEQVPEHELVCILFEVSDSTEAVRRAMEMIHDAHVSMGTEEVQTAKVTGSKLNSRGMKACLERMNGRDLIILEAGDLDDVLLEELVEEVKDPGENAVVILTDTPARLRELVSRSPGLAGVGVYEEESGQAALPFAEAILSMSAEEPEPAAKEEASAPAFDYAPAAVTSSGEEISGGPVSISQILPDIHGELTAAREPGTAEPVPAEEYTGEEFAGESPAEPEAEAPAPELTYDFDPEAAAEGVPSADAGAAEDTYESILGAEFSPPEGELSLDEQMAMAFGGPSEEDEELGDTAKLGGALAAELARMLDEPEAVSEAAPAEPVPGSTKEIGKLSAADLSGADDSEDLPDSEYAYEDDDYEDYDDYDELGYDEGLDEDDGSFGAIRGFTRYVEEYAASLDCVMDETAGLAVYACAEEFLGDGKPLTIDTARELVEHAMEQAERTSLRSVFAKKYDKQGRLILREQHFHVG